MKEWESTIPAKEWLNHIEALANEARSYQGLFETDESEFIPDKLLEMYQICDEIIHIERFIATSHLRKGAGIESSGLEYLETK